VQVYVIDSADSHRLEESGTCLHQMLNLVGSNGANVLDEHQMIQILMPLLPKGRAKQCRKFWCQMKMRHALKARLTRWDNIISKE